MKLYIIRNSKGLFFRPKGSVHYTNWEKSLEKAKFYPKIGSARKNVSLWQKNKNESFDILEFELNIDNAVIVNSKPKKL